MVGDFMSAIWDGLTDFASMIFDFFDKVGAIGYIVSFSIIGIFVSFIIANKLSVTSRLGDKSDKVRR